MDQPWNPPRKLCAHGRMLANDNHEWTLASACSSRLLEEYEFSAARAGELLRSADPGDKLRDVWLSSLRLYLEGTKNDHIRIIEMESTITNLCEVSSAFCIRLQRAEFERETPAEVLMGYGIAIAVRDVTESSDSPPASTGPRESNPPSNSSITGVPGTVTRRLIHGVESANQPPLAEQITTLRIECGWTIEALAERVGIEARSVLRHTGGANQPSALTLAKYCKAFSQHLGRTVVIRKMS